MMLELIRDNTCAKLPLPNEAKVEHHLFLIDGYINSHLIRNHSQKTTKSEENFLKKWFQLNSNNFYTWDAMNLKNGRQVIIDYINGIIKSGITSKTVRAQVGILSRYFSYVLEHPHVKIGGDYISIAQIYGPIDQPVSEYDIPRHTYDGEQLGVPLDPESLYDFFHCLKKYYLESNESISAAISARNYTMAVVAAESGLRADELLHLELSDLFFESYKIQTRFAKGTRGSGKRARTTLFTHFARDTVKFYISKYRHLTTGKNISTNYLFPNKNGLVLDYTSAHKALRDMINVAQKNNIHILNHMGWHWFRRIFATRFIERFPHQLSVLIELLGHTSPNTVHRYIRHSEAWMDAKILQILEESSSWPSIGN